jgi:hypothetical protein
MNANRAWVGLYRRLIGLYPASFRTEFGPEMLSVFAEKLAGAGRNAPLVVWHELVDLPFNLLREYIQNPGLNTMFERILTHQKHSRRRQAAALGFALSFILLELVNGLLQIAQNSADPPYTFWPGMFLPKIFNQPNGSIQATLFSLLVLGLLALAGLAAGLVISRAEVPHRPLRFGLAGAAGLPAAYVIIAVCSNLLASAAGLSPYVQALFNILSGALFGALVALVFGLLAGVPLGSLLRLPLAGFCGFVVGVLASIPATLAINILWGLIAGLLALATHTTTAAFFNLVSEMVLAFPVIAIQGWIFGSWLGNELGPDEPRLGQLAAQSGQLPAAS